MTAAGSLTQARYGHTATPLTNGLVLVVGGTGASGALATAQLLYSDPRSLPRATGGLAQARVSLTATRLSNGKVLVVGGAGASGILSSAEVYDPAIGVWSGTGSLNQARRSHTATLLNDGRVLVVGGENGTSPYLASAELY
ncbi:hypothetical protein F0U59_09495 [Archangium gephyra]|nr:hypothetical protein F0U59_09495 [Archangium gephyra]